MLWFLLLVINICFNIEKPHPNCISVVKQMPETCCTVTVRLCPLTWRWRGIPECATTPQTPSRHTAQSTGRCETATSSQQKQVSSLKNQGSHWMGCCCHNSCAELWLEILYLKNHALSDYYYNTNTKQSIKKIIIKEILYLFMIVIKTNRILIRRWLIAFQVIKRSIILLL